MKSLAEPGFRRFKILRNPHFWAIIVIVLALSFVYYSHIFFIQLYDQRWTWLWYLVTFEFKYKIHGSLFCIPFIYAATIFWWRGILLTWLFSIALLLPRILLFSPNAASFASNMIFLLIPLLVVIIIHLQRKWRETERKALEEKEEARQAYITQIFNAQEQERKRISREIHDDTTQRLWILANRLENLVTDNRSSITPQIAAELGTIRDITLDISGDAKRLSLALRPGILDNLGIVPALRWQVDQLKDESGIECEIAVEGHQRDLSPDINTHLYRIAQEALSNIRRHSGAKQARITLEFKQETIKMTIRDNGTGFSLKDINKLSKQNKLGIIGIQERARLLGGSVKIDSRLNRGTSISIELNG